MRSLFAIPVLAILLTPALAHADVIQVYALEDALLSKGGSVTGTITVDHTTDAVLAADLTIADGALIFPALTVVDPSSYFSDSGFSATIQVSGPDSGSFTIAYANGVDFPANLDGTYSIQYGNVFATDSAGTVSDYFNHAEFVPTPEPSALVFLGTGVLGAAGMARRRLAGK